MSFWNTLTLGTLVRSKTKTILIEVLTLNKIKLKIRNKLNKTKLSFHRQVNNNNNSNNRSNKSNDLQNENKT